MWVLLAFFVFLIILLNIFKRDFDSLFVSLSYFYVGVFFVYPLFIVESNLEIHYLNRIVDGIDYWKILISFSLFSLGFFVPSFLKSLLRSPDGDFSPKYSNHEPRSIYEAKNIERNEVGLLFWLAVVFILVNLLFGLMDAGRAERGYLVRQGVVEGDRWGFFLSIVVTALSVAVFFAAISARKHWVVFLVSFLMVLSMFSDASGRAGILVFLSVLFIHYSRVRVGYYLFGAFLVFPIILPLIVNMKDIIATVALHREVPDLLSYYSSDVSFGVILNNFGHPFVSLVFVDDLVASVGHRYFYDYLQGFLFYFRMLGFDFGDSLTYYNTEIFLGVRESVVPPGYLAFGFVQLGYLGVLFSGIFYRFVGFFAEYVFKVYGDIDNDALKFYFANIAAYTFYLGEIRTMVITFLLPMFVVYFSSKLMAGKRR